jgi:hypothetical protein
MEFENPLSAANLKADFRNRDYTFTPTAKYAFVAHPTLVGSSRPSRRFA